MRTLWYSLVTSPRPSSRWEKIGRRKRRTGLHTHTHTHNHICYSYYEFELWVTASPVVVWAIPVTWIFKRLPSPSPREKKNKSFFFFFFLWFILSLVDGNSLAANVFSPSSFSLVFIESRERGGRVSNGFGQVNEDYALVRHHIPAATMTTVDVWLPRRRFIDSTLLLVGKRRGMSTERNWFSDCWWNNDSKRRKSMLGFIDEPLKSLFFSSSFGWMQILR